MGMEIGVDEVGRGAWAGPVCVAAVQLLKPVSGLKDSKLLLPERREQLAHQIRQNALVGIGWASPVEIDELGLTKALGVAMKRSLISFEENAEIILDGAHNFLPERVGIKTVIKADNLIPSVSAASIVAKVARDNLMKLMNTRFPAYGFNKHVGYGTKMHQTALLENGICILHRCSFAPMRVFS